MNTKIKLTTRIDPNTSLTLDELSKANDIPQGKIIDLAVKYYAGGEDKNSDLDLLRKQPNKVQEQNEYLLNILNSLCAALGYDGAEFAPAETKPCKWLQECKNIRHQKMLKMKTDKLIKESEYH